MLCFMRALEIHVIETASDIDLALQAGLLEPSQLDNATCSDCDEAVGYLVGVEFEPFVVVIDEHDNDWVTCSECADSVTEGDLRLGLGPSIISIDALAVDFIDDDELEKF